MADASLLQEFTKEYEALRKSIGLKTSLEKLDNFFYVRDFIQKEGFVSSNLPRAISGRIVGGMDQWMSYIHSLLIPNPSNMPNVEENKMLDEDDKKKLLSALTKLMVQRSIYTKNGLKRDDKAEAEFIDSSVEMWAELSEKGIMPIVTKLNSGWQKNLVEKKDDPKPDYGFF